MSELGVADSIDFLGHLKVKETAELIAQYDALVLSGLIKCGGTVVLEAMAMRILVIVND